MRMLGGHGGSFFTLLMHDLAVKSGLFKGQVGHMTTSHNTIALSAGDYYIAGRMNTGTLCHGGRSPHVFSRSFA